MHRPKLIQPKSWHYRVDQRQFGLAQPGQSITEYAMIGALIIVVCIGALTMFGKNLTGVLGTLSSKAEDPALISVKPKLLAAPPVSGPIVLNGSPLNTGNNAAATAQAASAQQGITQTAGVNGTTEAYAQNILKAAQQALADGKINQSQYDLLVQMANQGHEMAVMEGLLQNSYQQNTGQPDFYSRLITYNGKSYTPVELSNMLSDATSNLDQLKTQFVSTNSTQTDLLNTVTGATSQIHSIASDNTGAISNGDSATIDRLLGSNSTSTATNQSSANICAAGQHLDVNNHCVH